jgi:hypothetical protein
MRLSSQWENGCWSSRNVFRISGRCCFTKAIQPDLSESNRNGFCAAKKGGKGQTGSVLTAGFQIGSVIYRCSLRSFLQTLSSNAMTLLYDVPEIVSTLAHQCKRYRLGSPKATLFFHAGRALQPPQPVPRSRRRAWHCTVPSIVCPN